MLKVVQAGALSYSVVLVNHVLLKALAESHGEAVAHLKGSRRPS